jgi:hypothetical protein
MAGGEHEGKLREAAPVAAPLREDLDDLYARRAGPR